MIKTFIQKTELVHLSAEISPPICQKNTLTHKLQCEEEKEQAKGIPTLSYFSSYNWIILERRMQESEGQRHGTNKQFRKLSKQNWGWQIMGLVLASCITARVHFIVYLYCYLLTELSHDKANALFQNQSCQDGIVIYNIIAFMFHVWVLCKETVSKDQMLKFTLSVCLPSHSRSAGSFLYSALFY